MLRTEQSDDRRRLIIGAPLMLIVVFCFGFFLIHPAGDRAANAVISESKTNNHKKAAADSAPAVSQLSPLPLAPSAPSSTSSSTATGSASTPAANSQASAGNSHVKNAAGKSKTATDSQTQEGLIQTVMNGLLNGR